jgi:hypothetical protein
MRIPDTGRTSCEVRKVPNPDIAPLHLITSSARARIVAGKSRPKAFRLEVDDRFDFCNLLHRKIVCLSALQYAARVTVNGVVGISVGCTVADETARRR